MREYRGNYTGEEAFVGWGPGAHERWKAPQACYVRDNKGGVKKGRGWQEKEWVACVENHVRSFKTQQNWKHAAGDAQSWTKTVTEGERRFMTEWRKKEEEKSESRREKRTAK